MRAIIVAVLFSLATSPAFASYQAIMGTISLYSSCDESFTGSAQPAINTSYEKRCIPPETEYGPDYDMDTVDGDI